MRQTYEEFLGSCEILDQQCDLSEASGFRRVVIACWHWFTVHCLNDGIVIELNGAVERMRKRFGSQPTSVALHREGFIQGNHTTSTTRRFLHALQILHYRLLRCAVFPNPTPLCLSLLEPRRGVTMNVPESASLADSFPAVGPNSATRALPRL